MKKNKGIKKKQAKERLEWRKTIKQAKRSGKVYYGQV